MAPLALMALCAVLQLSLFLQAEVVRRPVLLDLFMSLQPESGAASPTHRCKIRDDEKAFVRLKKSNSIPLKTYTNAFFQNLSGIFVDLGSAGSAFKKCGNTLLERYGPSINAASSV